MCKHLHWILWNPFVNGMNNGLKNATCKYTLKDSMFECNLYEKYHLLLKLSIRSSLPENRPGADWQIMLLSFPTFVLKSNILKGSLFSQYRH